MYNVKDREYMRLYMRKRRENLGFYLNEKHHVDLATYNAMFVKQNGLCAGCYKHQSQFKTRLSVDHDHKTGRVRGLLCRLCNQGIGLLRDNSTTLRQLADYLDRHSSI